MDSPPMLFMGDSITAADIPLKQLVAVAGYGDGVYEWSSVEWALIPSSIAVLSIVVSAAHSGDVLDVETGDATPDQVPQWVRDYSRPIHKVPTVYCNRVTLPQVVSALDAAGIPRHSVFYWIATLDGTLSVWYGEPSVAVPSDVQIAGVQWKGADRTGGHWDQTVILIPSWVGLEDDLDQATIDAINGIATQVGSNYAPNGIAGTLLSGDSPWQLKVTERLDQLAGPVDLSELVAAVKANTDVLNRIEAALRTA